MATLERADAASGVPVVRLAGILDQAGVRSIERAFLGAVTEALKQAVEAPASKAKGKTHPGTASRPLLVADVTGVTALSTSGISLLLGAHRQMEQGSGRFILIGTSGHCADVLRRCRLDTVFRTAIDVPAAQAAAGR